MAATFVATLVATTTLLLGASTYTFADSHNDIEILKQQVRELQAKVGGNHLTWKVDYRVTGDNIEYDLANGGSAENDSLLANRLHLTLGYKYNDNLFFRGQLAYNKAFGDTAQHSQRNSSGFADFDWVVNQNLLDNDVNVKEAYFLYKNTSLFDNEKLPWSFSMGRRPSTNGFLVNNREGFDAAQSPLGHSINVEFDGLSLNVNLDKLTGVPGMAFKICSGRGLSNATSRFSLMTGTDYATDEAQTDDIDMIGFIFTAFNNGQYDLKTQVYTANNLIGYDMMDMGAGFKDFGDINNVTVSLQVNGIGELINDFLDGVRLFASYSRSETDPNMGMAMLGSPDKESGESYWVGLNAPGFIRDGDSWGVEFNNGSKYWRAFTYGEDTMIGSKLAARGDAFEVYYNLPLIDEALTFQLRYTQIEYDYTGSMGFFGNATGTPLTMQQAQFFGMNPVKEARDIRATLRYIF
jgi:hypothetical protein